MLPCARVCNEIAQPVIMCDCAPLRCSSFGYKPYIGWNSSPGEISAVECTQYVRGWPVEIERPHQAIHVRNVLHPQMVRAIGLLGNLKTTRCLKPSR